MTKELFCQERPLALVLADLRQARAVSSPGVAGRRGLRRAPGPVLCWLPSPQVTRPAGGAGASGRGRYEQGRAGRPGHGAALDARHRLAPEMASVHLLGNLLPRVR